MIKIDKKLVGRISHIAKENTRKRINHNFHERLDDTLQRLLNAMDPDTYIQPHKHQNPDKREAFIILKGRAVVIEFDEKGNMTDHILLDNKIGNFGVEIPERTYHSVISLEEGTVLYEIKDGPYSPIDDKNFAEWAPKEGDTMAAVYLADLKKRLNVKM